MSSLLTLREISKKYGKKQALDSVDLSLEYGIYGLLGPNGAGKTTLLNILATVLKPDAGEMLWDGVDVQKNIEAYRSRIGYLPQQIAFYDNFTGIDFLRYVSTLKKKSDEDVDEMLNLVHLYDVRNKKIKTYSGGMKQRLGIAQALMGSPELLILDEPTVGLDLDERASFKEKLVEMSSHSIIILSTHIVSDVEETTERIIYLKEGRIEDNVKV